MILSKLIAEITVESRYVCHCRCIDRFHPGWLYFWSSTSPKNRFRHLSWVLGGNKIKTVFLEIFIAHWAPWFITFQEQREAHYDGLVPAKYSFWFQKNEPFSVSASLGLHSMGFHTDLSQHYQDSHKIKRESCSPWKRMVFFFPHIYWLEHPYRQPLFLHILLRKGSAH